MTALTNLIGAVLNSLLPAAGLAVFVWLAFRMFERRVNAATRHIVWWIALALVIALPCLPRRKDAISAAPTEAARSTFHIAVRPPLAPLNDAAPVTVVDAREHAPAWPYLLMAAWGALLLRGLAGAARSYRHFRAVKRNARPMRRLARGELMTSREVSSPVAVGFLHPAVILPETLSARLTAEELDCVVLHESAHLARYDDWSNLLLRLLDAALTLHPVAWWLLRQIERERELACDDWVVAHTGAARSYAQTLVRVLEVRTPPAESALATGLFTRGLRLRARIERVMERGREFSKTAARVPLGAAVLVLIGLAAAGARVPQWIAFAQKLEFDVASVKLNANDGPMQGTPVRSGDLVTMHNVQVYSVIFYAYHLTAAYQMVNYPDLPEGFRWWDIDARIGRDATNDEVRLMLQSLLEDRFKLKAHRETKEMMEYQITMGNGKPRLDTSLADTPLKKTIEGHTFTTPAGRCGGTLWLEGTHMVCHSANMEQIAKQASSALELPVADHTGLTGAYDLDVLYMTERQLERIRDGIEPAPPFMQAFSSTTGLRIEKGKGPVEVLVIDHLEKATANQ